MAALEFLSGTCEGQIHSFAKTMTIGSSEDCDVTLTENGVSRHHARIEVNGNKVEVFDLGSSNGTFVNFKRLEKEGQASVQDRDILFFGRTVVKFWHDKPPARGGASPEELRDMLRGSVPIAALRKPELQEAARRAVLTAERAEIVRRLGLHMLSKAELDKLLNKARS